MWNQIQLSLPPASSSSTRVAGSAESRVASTQPAEPAPTMVESDSPSGGAMSAMGFRLRAFGRAANSVRSLSPFGERVGVRGVTELSRDLNPSPHPSPYGRGSRPSSPRQQ